jgi:dihydrofolate reductase
MKTEIALVVAVAENRVIGARGGLPWRVKADMKRFRAVTMGKPLVMGRKTFDSIGRVLDGRDNIVITRQPKFAVAGVLTAPSLEEALALAEERATARGASEICVIGGGEIFREALAFADRLYVTDVAVAPAGDIYFPGIAPADWIEVSRENLPASEGDTAAAAYAVYERRR